MYFIVGITAFIASLLTFFSGFGLGTLLLPVFAVFYGAPTAIALTAIVHFLNNLFKISLVYKNIQWSLVLKFGVPSFIAAFIGAVVLKSIANTELTIFSYSIAQHHFNITLINLCIGVLMIVFSLFEIIPYLKSISFSNNKLAVGGLVSGFFGGLSGHQGALRSAFLVRLNLPKEIFIASGVAIACMVDIARMSIYAISFNKDTITQNKYILMCTVVCAFVGAYFGNKLLKKVTMTFLKWIVFIFMFNIAILLILGIIK